MKQIVVFTTLIVAVTAAILAYRFMANDHAGIADTKPLVNTKNGALPVEARKPAVPGSAPAPANGMAATPHVDADRASMDEADVSSTSIEAAPVAPPVGMSAGSRVEYGVDNTTDATTKNATSDGDAAAPGGNVASGSPAGSQVNGVPQGSGSNRAQNAVNSPGVDSPFLDKTYPDGRQYRPNAMQDYFGDEPVQPQNPVDKDKAAYYPEGRARMKDAFKDTAK